MDESILTSIKKMLGIEESYTQFDADIISHINSVFGILTQLGAGPSDGFAIKDSTALWSDFISNNNNKLLMVKTYVYMKVKMIFDPPQTGAVIDSTNRLISELEWRINVSVDPSELTT